MGVKPKPELMSRYITRAAVSMSTMAAFIGAAVSVSDNITAEIGAINRLKRSVAQAYPNKPKYLPTFEEASPLRNPSRVDIEDAVDRMEAGREGFIILERYGSDKTFIQAARESRNKYDLEYSTYIADSAYRLNIFACEGMATAKIVRVTMIDYARSSRSWISTCSWRRVNL